MGLFRFTDPCNCLHWQIGTFTYKSRASWGTFLFRFAEICATCQSPHRSPIGHMMASDQCRCPPKGGCPWSLVKAAVANLPLDHSSLVVDLGSGDGRLLQACSELYKCQCWGAELGTPGDHPYHADMFECSIDMADVVLMHLGRQCTPLLARTLPNRLRPGTVVRSIRYHIPVTPGLAPVGASGNRFAKVYDYVVTGPTGPTGPTDPTDPIGPTGSTACTLNPLVPMALSSR